MVMSLCTILEKALKNGAKSSLNFTFLTFPTCKALIFGPKPTMQIL